MWTKFVSILLILALTNLSACYSHNVIRNPVQTDNLELTEHDYITVKTIEGKKYTFKTGYIDQGQFIGKNWKGQELKWDLKDLESIDCKKHDTAKSIVSALGILAGLALITFSSILIAFASADWDDS